MKRSLWIALGAVAVALTAHGWYYHAHRDAAASYEAEIQWLATELQLSAAQIEQVRALHEQHCPEMNALHRELQSRREASPTGEGCAEVENRCAKSTERLIEAVAALLTPTQRERYLQLVNPCLSNRAPPAGA